MDFYQNLLTSLDELDKQHTECIKKFVRASYTHRGDFQNELDNIEEKRCDIESRIFKYESSHPEEFKKTSKATTQKRSRYIKLKKDTKNTYFRSEDKTIQILNKMKSNVFIRNIEDRLSKEDQHWINAQISIPKEKNVEYSYTFWYCYFQADAYRKMVSSIMALKIINFKYNLSMILNKMIDRNLTLTVLINHQSEQIVCRRLKHLSEHLKRIDYDLALMAETGVTLLRIKSELKPLTDDLIESLLKLSEEALILVENGGKTTELEIIIEE